MKAYALQGRMFGVVLSLFVGAIFPGMGCGDSSLTDNDTDSTEIHSTDSTTDSTDDTDSFDTGSFDTDSFQGGTGTECTPNETLACDCDGSGFGFTRCAPDGRGWRDCDCTEYGLALFVSPDARGGDGTAERPLGSLTEARDTIRTIAASTGLPAGGVVVWLREGVYTLTESFVLNESDAGTQASPIVYSGYPGETVRISGATVIPASAFAITDSSDAIWNRLDESVRGNVVQVNLIALGIADLGELTRRGFCGESSTSPPELIVNGVLQTLARWPDTGEGIGDVEVGGDTIDIFGNLTPDVTGRYTRIGENDDASIFQRDELVDGLQYHLYRYFWEYDGTWHRAWFLTTDEMGYPSDGDPWWYLYAENPAPMTATNGATGTPTFTAPDAVRHGFSYITDVVSDTAFQYGGTRPERWQLASDVWFHGYWGNSWADCRIAASEIDVASNTIRLASETGYGITTGQPFYAFNLAEEITQPGEYYIDRTSGTLYWYPPVALAGAAIELTVTNSLLVDMNGVSNTRMQNVVIENGRHHLARIQGGSGNLFDGVTLQNSGGRGISIDGVNNGIQNSIVRHTATTGVSMDGGDRPALTAGQNFVRNSDIHHFGRTEFTYRPGVRIWGVGQLVLNNAIHDAPHSAILFGGNEHLLARNHIHRVCQQSSDAGAIYTGRDWGARGNVIENNFIHHLHSTLRGAGVQGVYLDDCVSGITVRGNVLYDIQDAGIQHGGGRDNHFENNIMVRCDAGILADTRGYDWYPDRGFNNTPGNSWNLLEKLQAMNYQEEPWASAYPECAAIPNDFNAIVAEGALWLYPEGCTFERNLGYLNDNWMQGGDTFEYYSRVADNIEDADPLFVDESQLNLTLRSDSPALSIPGFVRIPFSAIGIQVQ